MKMRITHNLSSFNLMSLTYHTTSPQETLELGRKLALKLNPGDSVLLFGPLGAGKTHFVQGLAKGLGIEERISSPTYAYVKRYAVSLFDSSAALGSLRVGSKGSTHEQNAYSLQHTAYSLFYHYDLYRLNPGDDMSSIGLEDSLADPQAIHAIEWADRLGEVLPLPCVQVVLSPRQDHHQIVIRFEDPQIPSPAQIDEAYKFWATPLHVRKHMAQVAKVALKVAQAYADVGQMVNSELLYAGAILHDVARVCDFRTLDRAHFDEEITGAKWSRWVELRNQFKGWPHPTLGRDFLAAKGFGKTAHLVYAHGSRVIVEEPELLASLEAKILYYADKRVKHDEIVDLAERFRDGRERYGEGNENNRALFEEVEKRTFELEKELFEELRIGPEEIVK